MKTIKNRFKSIHFSVTLILMLVTIFLIIISVGIIINSMIEYKYTIDLNYNKTDIVLSMKSRSFEINSVLFYSKVLIGYFLVIIGYLWYRLKNKQTLFIMNYIMQYARQCIKCPVLPDKSIINKKMARNFVQLSRFVYIRMDGILIQEHYNQVNHKL